MRLINMAAKLFLTFLYINVYWITFYLSVALIDFEFNSYMHNNYMESSGSATIK